MHQAPGETRHGRIDGQDELLIDKLCFETLSFSKFGFHITIELENDFECTWSASSGEVGDGRNCETVVTGRAI
jgi:hypothetical protein